MAHRLEQSRALSTMSADSLAATREATAKRTAEMPAITHPDRDVNYVHPARIK
jgi:hypothetical protein